MPYLVMFIMKTNNYIDTKELWARLNSINIETKMSEDWIGSGYSIDDKFNILMPSSINLEPTNFHVFIEEYNEKNEEISFEQINLKYLNSIEAKKVKKNINYFNKYPDDLCYLFNFFPNDMLSFRNDIDLSNIENGVGIPKSIDISTQELVFLKDLWRKNKSSQNNNQIECNRLGIYTKYFGDDIVVPISEDILKKSVETNEYSKSLKKNDFTKHKLINKNKTVLPYNIYRDYEDKHKFEVKFVLYNNNNAPYVISYKGIKNNDKLDFEISNIQYMDMVINNLQ